MYTCSCVPLKLAFVIAVCFSERVTFGISENVERIICTIVLSPKKTECIACFLKCRYLSSDNLIVILPSLGRTF
jgi:hypothetical protein